MVDLLFQFIQITIEPKKQLLGVQKANSLIYMCVPCPISFLKVAYQLIVLFLWIEMSLRLRVVWIPRPHNLLLELAQRFADSRC